jgi:hypothetical protein
LSGVNKIRLPLVTDPDNQWFVAVRVLINGKLVPVTFKIDTGCNALVLSHSTLEKFGDIVDEASLSKLPPVSGKLASGGDHLFRKLGTVSLFYDKKKEVHICDTQAICHTTHETHDLLGTDVLRRFSGVVFNLTGDKCMELLK